MNFNGKNVLLLGLGREGAASFRFLKKNYPGARISVADRSTEALSAEAKELAGAADKAYLGEHYLDGLSEADVVIRSPGISPRLPQAAEASRRGVQFTTATEIFFELNRSFLAGITGSKGKSTCASLLFRILEESGADVELAGNIGRPMLQLLDSPPQTAVLELSSYQLETLWRAPRLLLIPSIFPDHLDYHGGFENYVEAKLHIIGSMTAEDVLIVNTAFDELRRRARQAKCRVVEYGSGANRVENDAIIVGNKPRLHARDIPLNGEHNLQNVLGVYLAALNMGVSHEAAARAISSFKPLPHRLQSLGVYSGIEFVDDAISTTPESTCAALQAFSGRVSTLLLGGTDRGYNFAKLAEAIINEKVATLLLFPDSGARIGKAVIEACNPAQQFRPELLEVKSMKEAVKLCYEYTERGKIALLSTASPSYSLFRNFEDKGDQFRREVQSFAGLS